MPAARRPRGRPTTYKWTVGEAIARRIIEGRSLYKACDDFNVSVRTAKHWLHREPEFRHMVRLAVMAAAITVGRVINSDRHAEGKDLHRVFGPRQRMLADRIIQAFYQFSPEKRREMQAAITIPATTDILIKEFHSASPLKLVRSLRDARSAAKEKTA